MGKLVVFVLACGSLFSAKLKAEVYVEENRVFFELKDESSQYMRPFSTDGCTMYGEGTCEKPYAWTHCCVEHDFKYWHGGSAEEKTAADQELSNCVSKSGFSDHAFMMLMGINLFASHTDRWGSGWHQNPGYRKLTNDEVEEYSRISPDKEQLQEITAKLIEFRKSAGIDEKLYCEHQEDQFSGQ
jgi:hypothetical protein